MKLNKVVCCSLVLWGASAAAQAPVENLNSKSLMERLTILERTISARNDAQQVIQIQLDEMQLEVNELRGAVELHTHKLEQILQRQRELYLEIDRRVESLAQAPVRSAEVSEPVVNETQLESEMYDGAVNLILKEKKYDEAIPEFRAFLKSYPQSEYAPNAHYWLGQLLFNKRDWGAAEQHFEQVVKFYPDSGKRADSILKLGVIAQKRSNIAKATQLFEQVIAEYPNASEKRLAETRLKNIREGAN
ncbi:tol-pal system protein YbgF [Planctobacterium marinum]|uniref:Cell division coordinator CpoB n=1 Tax=Planctobacterium marinum TaxID=1631968 RepID=A0AA48HM34_9ALTE|nr:tol-pal system protein YbgF [Planctobacterium marinum]